MKRIRPLDFRPLDFRPTEWRRCDGFGVPLPDRRRRCYMEVPCDTAGPVLCASHRPKGAAS